MNQSQHSKLAGIAAALGIASCAFMWQASIEPGFFVHSFTANLWADHQSGPLTINVLSNVPWMKPWLASVAIVSGIPLADIHSLPFGAVMRGVLYFAIVGRLTGRFDLAAGLGLAMVIYPWTSWGYNTMFVHSLGGFLFLSFVLLVIVIADDFHRPLHSMVGFALLIALFGFDYTASAWAGISLVALVVVARYRPSIRVSGMLTLVLLGGILFSLKTTIATFAGLFEGGNPASIIGGYFSSTPTESVRYEYVAEGTGLGLAGVVYGLIALAFLVYGLAVLWSVYRDRDITTTLSRLSTRELAFGAFLFAGGVTTVLYTLMGRFTQFFIFLMGPLAGFVALWYAPKYLPTVRKHRGMIATVFVVILVASVGAEFSYQMHTGDIDHNSNADGASTAEWLALHTSEPAVQTDLTTSGRMRLAEEKHNGEFEWKWHDEESYATVVEHGDPDAEYTVIDLESEAGVRSIGGWKRFESFGSYEAEINTNPNIDRIYHDGTHGVFS